MKRTTLFAILMAFCAIGAQAQLVVDSLGYVGIGTNTPDRALFVKGDTKFQGDSTYAVTISNVGTTGSSYAYGLNVSATISDGRAYGVYSNAFGATSNTKPVYGLVGLAGRSQKCAGVYGGYNTLSGVNNFAAIYGNAVSATIYPQITPSGIYAGYFAGDVRV